MIPAADSFETIRERLAQLRAERTPMCPIITGRTLHDCLRSPGRCGESCPHRDDWMGPQE